MEKLKPIQCVFLGVPGSGVDIIAQKLSETFDLTLVTPENLYRWALKRKTDSAKIFIQNIQQGMHMSDMPKITTKVIKDYINANRKMYGFIVYGCTLTSNMASKLDSELRISKCYKFEISNDVYLQRNSMRMVHKKSGRVYYLGFNPPEKSMRDDITSELLTSQPALDLEEFENTFQSVYKHYEKKNMLFKVDCSHKLEEIYSLMEQEFRKSQTERSFFSVILGSLAKGMVTGGVEIVKEQCKSRIWYSIAYVGALFMKNPIRSLINKSQMFKFLRAVPSQSLTRLNKPILLSPLFTHQSRFEQKAINKIEKGDVIKIKGQMRIVNSVQISAQQMRRSIALVKCTDLITGKSFEERFRPEDRVEVVETEHVNARFVSIQNKHIIFEDEYSGEEIKVPKTLLSIDERYLVPEMPITVILSDEKPVQLRIPEKFAYTIEKTDDPKLWANDDRKQMPNKQAVLDCGVVIYHVPVHIEEGERVLVSLRDNRYVSKAGDEDDE